MNEAPSAFAKPSFGGKRDIALPGDPSSHGDLPCAKLPPSRGRGKRDERSSPSAPSAFIGDRHRRSDPAPLGTCTPCVSPPFPRILQSNRPAWHREGSSRWREFTGAHLRVLSNQECTWQEVQEGSEHPRTGYPHILGESLSGEPREDEKQLLVKIES